ncbi:hypothetical protein [Alkaliphilus oremlandii]|uniref:hypothetical protein n=1 Tax=Alkaliphilus oremlandii TaxID=461876 RepID=UPI0002EA51FB|nr:hypothetical protein [Alkaliphilus oremlandii]
MKKLIILVLSITMVLAGCSGHKDASQRFKKDNFKSVVIGNGKMLKLVMDDEDTKALVDLFNTMVLKEMDKNLKEEPFIKVHFFGNDAEDTISIVFLGEKVFSQKEWYAVDLEFTKKLYNFYEGRALLEVEDDTLLEIQEKRADRANLDWKEALEGTWIVDDTTALTFDEEFLYQGDYKLKYVIHEAEGNRLLISAYGIHGLFTKNQKLFDMDIIFSEDLCNVQTQKIVPQFGTRDLVFQNNMIYQDEEGNILGDLSSVFFSENLLN